jgi:hypothetical protein
VNVDYDFDPAAIALGQRALAAGFRARRIPGGCGRDDSGVLWMPSDRADWDAGGDGRPVPDLRDGPTRGAALDAARALWDDLVYVAPRVSRRGVRWYAEAPTWAFRPEWGAVAARGFGSEGEAIVELMEKAPGR